MADDAYLEGHCLIAMPTIGDPRFDRTLIYMCAHSADGAMGLVVNKPLDDLSFDDLLEQLGIDEQGAHEPIQLHFGGPVETGRGFVLHSDDYNHEGTLNIGGGVSLTATVDVLRAMATGEGPRDRILALGYAGWAPGQLDLEIQRPTLISYLAGSSTTNGVRHWGGSASTPPCSQQMSANRASRTNQDSRACCLQCARASSNRSGQTVGGHAKRHRS
jgi:putative transcriptional regulator